MSDGKEFHKLIRCQDCLKSGFKELHKLMCREGDCLISGGKEFQELMCLEGIV